MAVEDPLTQLEREGLLRPGQSVALLQALHILTREGRLNQDSRRKLKQVRHLIQFIEPLLAGLPGGCPSTVVDFGAGKSYLGFLLYDLCLRDRPGIWVVGVDTRADLMQRSAALAQQAGFERMRFLAMAAADADAGHALPGPVRLVTALHACDTATDDAIGFGLRRQVDAMALVPCCQAEVASLLRQNKAISLARTPLAELWRHPLHTREMGSQITNVLRCLYLQARGYEVTVTELVGWEHSLKNELIIARRRGRPSRSARQRLLGLLDMFGLNALLQTRYRLD